MSRGNPRLNQGAELLRPLQQFSGFGLCGNLDPGIVDHVPLAPAGIEEQDEPMGRLAERQTGTLEAEA